MGLKILCAVFSPATGTFGSLTRILALARAFQARGDEVRFCASGNAAELVREKKIPVVDMPSPTLFGLPSPLAKLAERRAPHMRIPVREGRRFGSVWFVFWLTGMLRRGFLGRLVDAELRAIEEFRPDIVVTEMDPGAYLAARISGRPLVTTYARVSEHGTGDFFWRLAKRRMNRVLKNRGMPPVNAPEDLIRPDETHGVLAIIPSIPELDGSIEGKNVKYVGNLLEPVRDDRPTFSPAPSSRYVFVYAGTGSFPIDALKKTIPAAFSEARGVECLVAAESLTQEEKIGNAYFLRWVPAAEILNQCDLVICHGGLNTITQSVEAGVPLVVFPGPIFERRYNAEMIEKNGAGAMGEWSDMTPEWIRRQYERREDFIPGVRRLQEEFRRRSGAGKAAETIAEWLTARKK